MTSDPSGEPASADLDALSRDEIAGFNALTQGRPATTSIDVALEHVAPRRCAERRFGGNRLGRHRP